MKKNAEQINEHSGHHFATLAVHGGESGFPHNPLSVPIYQNAVFAFDDIDAATRQVETGEGYIYSRIGNPTVDAFEEKMAILEGGESALAFASGMAAISAVCMTLAKPGDHIVSARHIYSGAHTLMTHQLMPMGYRIDFVDTAGAAGAENLKGALRDDTRFIYLESPSNPELDITDIAAVIRLAAERGITTVIDNTFATPYLQQPLKMGIDVAIHSATKYIGGHGDAVGGVIVGRRELVRRMRYGVRRDFGGILAPMHAWLYLRGLKTLPLRMDRHCRTALEVARFLELHPAATQVFYPGLPSHPDHELARNQMRHFGGVVSFRVASRKAGKQFCDALHLCTLGVSLGDAATLALHPASMFHAKESDAQCLGKGVDPFLVRISVGLEDPADILKDIGAALDTVESA